MAHQREWTPRWPAYATAVVFLGYALGKAVFASQGKLGFPGGPPVPASEYERYTRDIMDVATAQWSAVGTGVLGALLVLATVTSIGRRIPRWLMLSALAVALVAVGAGAAIMALDAFVGLGVGWQWYHGILGIVVLLLLGATTVSYARATRRVRD